MAEKAATNPGHAADVYDAAAALRQHRRDMA
jgi:hypothetical protein